MSGRSRNWCFTLNNWVQEEYERIVTLGSDKQTRYMVVGKELGGQEHTPHLQGFVAFHNPKDFSQAVAWFGNQRLHVEKAAGNVAQNVAYCTKDGSFVEIGEAPHAGARTDIAAIKAMVKSGATMQQICDVATSTQSIRMAELCMKYKPLKERSKPFVSWYVGPAGSGKTAHAYEVLGYESTWQDSENLSWFDGYDGHKNVIIDDFRGSHCKYSWLLRVLDRYPLRVPIKGGFVSWVPERIIITSSKTPQEAYSDESIKDDIQQLLRRIDEVITFPLHPIKVDLAALDALLEPPVTQFISRLTPDDILSLEREIVELENRLMDVKQQ